MGAGNSPGDAEALHPSPEEDGRCPAEAHRCWHLVAAITMIAMAVVTMRGWLAGDLIPPHDFAGYVSAVEDVRDGQHGVD